MKKQLSVKHKILSITAIVCVLVFLIGGFVIYPSIRYIKNIKQSIDVTESQMEEQYQKIRLLKKSITELDTIREKTQKFSLVTIQDSNKLAVIQELEQLAAFHQVNQSLGLTYTDNTYRFNFKLTGTFEHIMNYIRALETRPYYITIPGLTWTKPIRESEGNTVALSFEGYIKSN